jgi:L-serine/L-threonine ammonia-lyase
MVRSPPFLSHIQLEPRLLNQAWLYTRHGSLNWRSRIFLKLETLQPSGSFKSRGIGHYCQVALARSTRPDAVHFYASSGGNAGLACVFAAKSLGCPSTVVVPHSTKPMMIAKIRAAGATQVIQEGKSLKEAIAHLQEVVMPEAQARGEEAIYVPPFDHENVWRGNQTVFEEVAKQMADQGNGEADVMACSVGGGGLLIGMLQGMAEAGWWNTQVLAVETEGADSLSESLKMGELVALPGISSQATSLGAVKVADRAFELAQRHEAAGRVRSVVLSDAEAAMGCWRFADDEKSLVELACGVNLALCYGGRLGKALGRKVKPDDKVVIIVCGGSNVTTAMVEGWRQEYGYLDDRITHEVPSAKTGLVVDLPTCGVPLDHAGGMAGFMPIRV